MNSPQKSIRTSRSLLHLAVVSLACVALASPTFAANNTWKGIDGSFNNAANWSGVLSATDTLTFPAYPIPGGSGVTNLTNNSGITTFAGVNYGVVGSVAPYNITINTIGTANYGALNGQNVGNARGGVLTFVSTYTGSGSQTLTVGFGTGGTANNSVGDGNIVNLVTSGGTQGIGGTNNFAIISGAVGGFLRSRDYYNGADFLFNDTVNNIARAPVYDGTNNGITGVPVGGSTLYTTAGSSLLPATDLNRIHYYVASSITGQGTVMVNSIKFGTSSTVDITQTATTTLTVGTSGTGNSAGGLLRSGGGSTTISGGNVAFGSGNNFYIRTDTAADKLIINSNMTPVSNNNVVKTGAGTFVIGGTDTLTGNTWVDEGTLLVTGKHTTGTSYFINPEATLGGSGDGVNTGLIQTILTNTVQVSGTIAPGNSLGATPALQTGKLTVNTTAFNLLTGSTFAAQLGGTGAGLFDQLALTNAAGTISLTGTVTLSLNWVGAGTPFGTYRIIDTSVFSSAPSWATLFSGTTNGGTVGISGLPGGYISTIGYGATGVTITIVPEPREYAVGMAGLLGVIILIRKRRRSAAV